MANQLDPIPKIKWCVPVIPSVIEGFSLYEAFGKLVTLMNNNIDIMNEGITEINNALAEVGNIDDKIAGKYDKTGGTITGNVNIQGNLDLEEHEAQNISKLTLNNEDKTTIFTPTNYLTDWSQSINTTITGTNKLDITNTICNTPTSIISPANKEYVDEQFTKAFPKTGGTITGNVKIDGDLDMSHRLIKDVDIIQATEETLTNYGTAGMYYQAPQFKSGTDGVFSENGVEITDGTDYVNFGVVENTENELVHGITTSKDINIIGKNLNIQTTAFGASLSTSGRGSFTIKGTGLKGEYVTGTDTPVSLINFTLTKCNAASPTTGENVANKNYVDETINTKGIRLYHEEQPVDFNSFANKPDNIYNSLPSGFVSFLSENAGKAVYLYNMTIAAEGGSSTTHNVMMTPSGNQADAITNPSNNGWWFNIRTSTGAYMYYLNYIIDANEIYLYEYKLTQTN